MVGDLVILVKDLDDDNDEVAIRVEMPAFGRIGYVATSVQNCAEGTESAELIYDTFDGACFARVMFVTQKEAIAKMEYGIGELIFAAKVNIDTVEEFGPEVVRIERAKVMKY